MKLTAKEIVLKSVPAAIFGLIMCYIFSTLVVGFPTNEMVNNVNNGISGLFSGYFGALFTLIILNKKVK